MIAELKKALEASKHPGLSSKLTFSKLVRQSLPYFLSPSGMARPPLTIYWSVNSVCNLRCMMCDVGNVKEDSNFYRNLKIDGKLHEIPIDKFRSVLDEVAAFKPMISINSTEPLMYKPLGEAVEYARRLDMDVSVTTGGYTLPKRAEELAKAGLSRLNVSIDAPPKLHNIIRGRDDCFAKATEGIVKFKEEGRRAGYEPEVLVNCTITNINYHSLEEFYDSLEEYPIDRVNITFMHFVTKDMATAHNDVWKKRYPATLSCINEETQPGEVDVDMLYDQLRAVKEKAGNKLTLLPDFSKDQLRRYFYQPLEFMGGSRCMSSWFIAQVIATGEVIPYARCYNVPFGNINDSPFLEVWNSDRAKAWRKDLRKNKRFPACARCDMVY